MDSSDAYETLEIIRDEDGARIEKISRGGEIFIRRFYADDKRDVFEALASLNSPYIPRIEKIEFGDGTSVIENFMDGVPLSEYILTKPVSRRAAEAIAEQLLEALRYLWKKSIIHRDIKPDNILVSPSIKISIIDFGISRIHRSGAARDTSLFGTSGYAPPEQYGFAQTDGRADIFAAGMVIKELCEAAGYGQNSALYKFAAKCTRLDPDGRYLDAVAALRGLRTERLKKFVVPCAALAAAVFIAFMPASFRKPTVEEITLNEPEMRSALILDGEKEGYVFGEGNIFEFDFDLREENIIAASFGLSEGVLSLELKDRAGRSGEYHFKNESPPEIIDYPTDFKYGEIIIHDLDGDGRMEILAVISSRSEHGFINWTSLWCVGYDNTDGFWRASGELSCVGSGEYIEIIPRGFGGGLLLSHQLVVYHLEERELTPSF